MKEGFEKFNPADDNIEELHRLGKEKIGLADKIRGEQLISAKQEALRTALQPAIYTRDLIDLMLEPAERARFAGFMREIERLENDFTTKT